MTDLQPILEAAVAAGHAPGFCAAVITPDGGRHSACVGVRGIDNPAPMTPDTLFLIASCTKAITSVAALQLVERGMVGLDEPVGPILPSLAAPKVLTGFAADGVPLTRPAKGAITLRRLLTHTSGLAYDFTSADLARWLAATGGSLMGVDEPDIPLMFDPGEDWLYGIGIDWTGRLIEAVSGQTLDAYVERHILAPLGMTDTAFFPDAAMAGRRASIHHRLDDGALAISPMGMPPVRHFMMGGAGLHSTAADYLKFLSAILAGGAPLLRPETFATMMGNQTGDLEAGAIASANAMFTRDFNPLSGLRPRHSLAGLINLDAVPGGRSAGSLTWAGIANCYYWADPVAGVAGVLMAQMMPFADPAIMGVFAEIEQAAYRALR